MLYRRGLDVAPTNERLVENYRRLRMHRAPDGLYASAGPGKVALARAQVSRHLCCSVPSATGLTLTMRGLLQ